MRRNYLGHRMAAIAGAGKKHRLRKFPGNVSNVHSNIEKLNTNLVAEPKAIHIHLTQRVKETLMG